MASLCTHAKTPESDSPDETEVRTEREGLEDVGPASDAPIEMNGNTTCDGIDHAGQRSKCRGDAVELSTPVV